MDEDLQRRGVLEGALMLLDQKGSSQSPPSHIPITEHRYVCSTKIHGQGNATTQTSALLSRLGGILTGKESSKGSYPDSS